MPNPRAQRPLSLQAVTEDIRSLAQPAEALLDMLAGAAKGSVTATAGIGGDLESLARGLAAAYRAPSGQRMDAFAGGLDQPTALPTTKNISDKLPAVVPTTAPLSRQHTAEYGQGMGEFIPTPGSGKVVKGGLSMAGQALNDRLLAGQSLTPLLNTPAPITHVIKPKGGNWMTGSVEKELNTLKRNKTASQALEEMERVYPPDVMERMSPETRAQVERAIPHLQRESALNNWVDRNLTNFVKKEMATPEDPVRKLAEQGITHYPVAEDPGYWARHGATAREERGGEAMAQSPLAKQWENRTDAMIDRESAQQHQDMMHLAPGMYSDKDEWIKKLDPSTQLYSAQSRHFSPLDLGFDHILDVLREDLAAGRIRPEQLNKVSMEQAVRRTYEYDQELAKKMADARAAAREGLPVHKEYPEGFRWVELNKPGAFSSESEAMGHSVRGYEPPKGHEDWIEGSGDMGNLGYGHGGWEAIKSGRAKVYSLVDPKGNPHVTVEVRSGKDKTGLLKPEELPPEVLADIKARNVYDPKFMWRLDPERNYYVPELGPFDSVITQIKGKQNAAPKPEYLPYVQDFVRGGQWSDVRDLQNTGLHKLGSEYLTPQEAETKFKPMVSDALNYLETHPSLERHRAARQARNDFKGDLRSPEYRQLEKQAGESIAPDVPYTYAELKALLSSPEDWTDRGDTIYTPISTALEQIERARQHLGPLPPTEGMKRGGKVHISDNPDSQMMEVEEQKFGVGGAAVRRVLGIKDHAERAVMAQNLLVKMAKEGQVDPDMQRALLKAQSGPRALPTVLPRAKPKTKEEIREYAQRTADQMNAAQAGEFLRAEPNGPSINAAGKSKSQWEMEQGLKHDIRPLGLPLDPIQVSNIEDQLGMLKMGITGDTSISDQVLHRAGMYGLPRPSEQQGGPLYGLRKRNIPMSWASNVPVLENVAKDVNEFSRAYGNVPVIGQYNSMGPQGTNFAQHFADANLEAIDITKMTPEQVEKTNDLIRKGNEKSGPVPDFPGIEDPSGAYFFFSFYPELRKHFNAIMTKPDYTKSLGLPDGRVILHAITEPELRDMPVLTSGKAQYQLVPGQDPSQLPLSSHSTYSHDLPRDPKAPVMRTPYPVPAEFEFSDVVEYAKPRYKPQEMTRVLQTAAPRQIIDQQHIDEIKMYEEMMKGLTGKKKGGQVKKAEGGEITADDLTIEERPL